MTAAERSQTALRPRIGVSACLLGERVRYDGRDKLDRYLVERLGLCVQWVGVCPEVEAGFGVPREPVDLHATPAGPRMRGARSGRDRSEELEVWSQMRLSQLMPLDGHVLKSASPSCGPMDVPVHGSERGGTGLYAAALRAFDDELPLATELDLADPRRRRLFLDAVGRRFALRCGSSPPDWPSPIEG